MTTTTPTSDASARMDADALRSGLIAHAIQRMNEDQARLHVPCKVCGADAALFDVIDFAKTCNVGEHPRPASGIPVYYRRCVSCHFIATEFFDCFTPQQWTDLVYNTEYYASVDPEYNEIRPRGNATVVDALLGDSRDEWVGLDYGGGNGETAARLRAMGYHYDCHDPFGCRTVTDDARGRYNFCSVFEVAEHTPDPKGFIADVVSWCTPSKLALLIGTHVHDEAVSDANGLNWWYAAPRNGHVSLHSRRSLRELARQEGLNCLSLSEQTHLLTRGYSDSEAWRFLVKGKLRGRLKRLVRALPGLRPT